ncbi:uncharacterized protein [Blastocystis hominis]|uniref:Uncharacterized protein n=1 Tax=Blastocystis hominis TaxID=12968 RepID=D8M1A8_BLAHO|nr:uncharacterized protein [Blastocystis hominis]CBK21847.2 unnamed protein product [Blastocystis hominis]|eukprot:XP_012895895.1 uncharacterized protein [Blastocystis hominis]
MVFLQSKSEFALADDPANQPVDEVDAALSQQLNGFVRQAVRQINHPEEMIVSVNQRHYLFYSIAEYVAGLQVYEKEAGREEVVLPPLLEGSIVAMEQSINLNECIV